MNTPKIPKRSKQYLKRERAEWDRESVKAILGEAGESDETLLQRDRESVKTVIKRALSRPVPLMEMMEEGGQRHLRSNYPDELVGYGLLMNALATSDFRFLSGLLYYAANASPKGAETDELSVNFMLSVMQGIEPRDQLETMLAGQMAAVHRATMAAARWLAQADTIPQQDSAERALNKLARTYATQMEALKRYRAGGEQQNVTVQQVSVNQGGQAIVGHVTQAPRESPADKAASSSPPRLIDAKMAPIAITANCETDKATEPAAVPAAVGRDP